MGSSFGRLKPILVDFESSVAQNDGTAVASVDIATPAPVAPSSTIIPSSTGNLNGVFVSEIGVAMLFYFPDADEVSRLLIVSFPAYRLLPLI
jgi:hypothetical protein